MATTINHEKKYQQFTADLDGDEAELAYAHPSDSVIDFTHTFVPKSERNNGVAEELMQTGLDYAREQQLKVRATCPAVSKYINTHPEYQDLLE
ncbi:GNAT family N-acetyltransferase [Pontibacter sp. MBLB2868]|uniref:GNAT family N-acetyltransferase n=1 Tax=Pontibacter sp. MBLB2868 TaxID=3451555 RepID=UPI003F74B409